MSDPMTDVPLASEFAPASLEQWRKLVDRVLKGAPFDRRLVAKTYDGLRIEPLYPRKPSAVPVLGRAPGARWQVVQRLDHPDPATANLQARQDLENGATALALVFAGSIGASGLRTATHTALTLGNLAKIASATAPPAASIRR